MEQHNSPLDGDFDLQAVLSQIMGDEPVEVKQVVTTTTTTVTAPRNKPVTTVVPKAAPVASPVAVRALDPDAGGDQDDDDNVPGSALVSFPTFTVEDFADTMDIRNYATLCKLRVRKYLARVKDKNAARNAETRAGAVADAYSAYKRLFAGTEDKLKAVNTLLDAARTRHYAMTIPWSVVGLNDAGKRRDGPRLLPNTLFNEYITEMGHAKQEVEAAKTELRRSYPQLLVEAKKNLGTAFDITQYKTADEMCDAFDLEFDFSPIPAGADYKGLPDQQVAALKGKLDKSMRQSMENAMRDVWARCYKVVSKMHERLGDPNKMFHDTLVSNVRELAALMSHLNATQDPRIEEIRVKVEQNLCRFEPKTLREELSKRALTAKLAKEIMDDMERVGVEP